MKYKHGTVQVLIALDQLANTVFGFGSDETWADETMSSRCGRLGHRYPYKAYKVVIDTMFYPFQGADHCVNAYKKELTRYQSHPSMR